MNIGPGSKWGLELLYGKSPAKELNEKLNHLHSIQNEFLTKIHLSLNNEYSWEQIAYKNANSNYPFLSITNIEGALCEFRKYWNISNGHGRRKYFKPSSYLTKL